VRVVVYLVELIGFNWREPLVRTYGRAGECMHTLVLISDRTTCPIERENRAGHTKSGLELEGKKKQKEPGDGIEYPTFQRATHATEKHKKKKPATHARVRVSSSTIQEWGMRQPQGMGMRLCTLFSARTRSTYDPRIRHACTIKAVSRTGHTRARSIAGGGRIGNKPTTREARGGVDGSSERDT
jgi:hypothetical protein